ncbi:MAG TPA: hypothetical protein VHU84_04460 [Lacipirellulaceae bacterium]|jgi:hypothetical protein|nr:hypothetical protein [Lacipirellulaceae bacterium]
MKSLPDDWTPDSLVVEIDARDHCVANGLRELGCDKFLGVAQSAPVAAQLEAQTGNEQRFVAKRDRRWVLYNNADVLFLSGTSARYLWKYRDMRHARYVAWEVKYGPVAIFAMLGWLVRFLVRQYERPNTLRLWDEHGKARYYFVSRITRRKRCYHDALHFIPHRLKLDGLFRHFRDHQVRHAVLRWFESLPEIVPTGDIDLLVADEDFTRVLQLLGSEPGIQPCDLYTPSGLPRSSYLGASYYPPALATQILNNGKLHKGFCGAPSEPDYFYSLAYHAVYHKGPDSDLPGSKMYRRHDRNVSHDFTSILGGMAARLGIKVDISLDGLHEYLGRVGWSPTPDLIVRVAAAAPRNRWLQALASRVQTNPSLDPGLTVFVIRESAIEANAHEKIIASIQRHGFSILAQKTLTATESARGALLTRGGNWGPGPRDHLGGLPSIVVAGYDPQPLRPSRAQRKRYPLVTNARVLVKDAIRSEINETISPRRPINGVHSSDHGGEAHHFMQVFAPELLPAIRDEIAKLRGEPVDRRQAA